MDSCPKTISVLLADPSVYDEGWCPWDDISLKKLKEALESLPYTIEYLEDHSTLIERLQTCPPEFVFNLCDEGYMNVNVMEPHLPALMDVAGVPFTGSGIDALVLCRDKAIVAAVAARHGVATPREVALTTIQMDACFGNGREASLDDLIALVPMADDPANFPLFVKPRCTDGSIGIEHDCIAPTATALLARLEKCYCAQIREVLVQTYLPGREFTVAAIGNPADGNFEVFPILEVDFAGLGATQPRVLLYEGKRGLDDDFWDKLQNVRAELPAETEATIRRNTAIMFEALKLQDYSRMDFRLGAHGEPYLLDVNPNNWIGGKYLFCGAMAGLDWPQLLKRVVDSALVRVWRTRGEASLTQWMAKVKADQELQRLKTNPQTAEEWSVPRVGKLMERLYADVAAHGAQIQELLYKGMQRFALRPSELQDFLKLVLDLQQRFDPAQPTIEAPRAKTLPHTSTTPHKLDIDDEYHWMTEHSDGPEFAALVEQENIYAEKTMQHLEPLVDTITEEIMRAYYSMPPLVSRLGQWEYLTMESADKEYPVHARRLNDSSPLEVLLDENELAKDQLHCDVMQLKLSPDGTLLAYTVDFSGSEVYELRVLDLETKTMRPHRCSHVGGYFEWVPDSRRILYVGSSTTDTRDSKVFLHHIDQPESEDLLLLEEADESCVVSLELSASARFLVIKLNSQLTSETHLCPLDDLQPTSLFCVRKRIKAVDYTVADSGDYLYISTNALGAYNYKIVRVPLANVAAEPMLVLPNRQFVMVESIHALEKYLVVLERSGGSKRVRIVRTTELLPVASMLGKSKTQLQQIVELNETMFGLDHYISFPDVLYACWPAAEGLDPGTARCNQDKILATGAADADYKANIFRFYYSTLKQPAQLVSYDVEGRIFKTLYNSASPNFDPHDYQMVQEWAMGADGCEIPISLLYSTKKVVKGSAAPCLLYGYGAYGSAQETTFASRRFSLVDRGVIFAIAHVRGGCELGRAWYDEGSRLNKKNSFLDLISCADHLIRHSFTSADRLAIEGRSAGGLLMAAVLNMRPDICKAALIKVPFVDVMTTMLNDQVSWTQFEFEEWGDPISDPLAFSYIKSYCPYTNIRQTDYPYIMVVSAMSDPYVNVSEPAKYVSRLRVHKTDSRPLLFRVNQGGHLGASGQDYFYDLAVETAFVLDRIGVAHTGSAARHIVGVKKPLQFMRRSRPQKGPGHHVIRFRPAYK